MYSLIAKMSSSNCNKMDCVSNENLCLSCLRTHELRFTWTIANFTIVEAKGKSIRSSTFSSLTNKKIEWRLKMRPNGISSKDDDKDKIALFLYLKSISKKKVSIFGKFKLSILNDKQETLREWEDNCSEVFQFSILKKNRKTDKPPSEEGIQYDPMGWREFIKKDDVFRKQYLINDTLTICCELMFSTEMESITTAIQHQCKSSPFQHLSENFRSILDNEEFTDVTLSVKGKNYRAHKAILAGRSKVFAKMFKRDVEKNQKSNIIDITDINEKVFASLLRYIYTEECHNLKDVAAELLVAADKYELPRLKLMCAVALYDSLSVANSIEVFILADSYGISELKNKAIEFIITNSAEVMKSARWKSIHVSKPELLHEVCQALSRRMESNCKLV